MQTLAENFMVNNQKNIQTLNLSIKQELLSAMRDILLKSDGDNESFCFIYCFKSESSECVTYYPHVLIPIENEYFITKEKYALQLQLEVMKKVYNDFVHEKYSCLISCHSHPFDTTKYPTFSIIDDNNDITQSKWFYSKLAEYRDTIDSKDIGFEYLHLVIGQKGLNVRKYDTETGVFKYLDKVTVFFENKIHYFFPAKKNEVKKNSGDEEIHERTRNAFGTGLVENLRKLSVAIVGLGGIGSIMAEGIARLGASHLILIDPDKVDKSNLNRFQGASIKDIGKYKVTVVARNLKRYLDNNLIINTYRNTIYSEEVLNALKSVDYIIGCIDNHPARYLLNRIAIQYLIAYFDAATRIMPIEHTKNISVSVRIGMVIPSITSCMDCSIIEYYSQQEIYFEFVDQSTRQQLEESGYILGESNIKNPAVYPQNMIACGILLLELMNAVSPYKPLYNNVYFDYSKPETETKIAIQAMQYLKAKRRDKRESCMNCDYYLGKADSIHITLKKTKRR
jgi:molybdopterin/thiamine biosynthesis adenylyltransferase